MEFEDSRNALFVEPNAFVQNFNRQERKNNETKKIVFQEPYECLPNHYLNNNFTKHGCECLPKHNNNLHDKQDCNCNHKKDNCQNQYGWKSYKDCDCNHHAFNEKNSNGGCDFNSNLGYKKDNCVNQTNRDDNRHNDRTRKNGFGFDLKSLMPLMGLFNKGGGTDLSQLVGLLNNASNSQNGNNSNPMNLISSLMSNKDAMSGILNLFKGGGLNFLGKSKPVKKEIKTTDFQIKNYTRVE